MNQKTKDRQNKAIQIHLTVFGHINSWEAIRLYDITRLSARIWDLRNQYGMKIETKPTVVETKWGKTTVADYVLVGERAEQIEEDDEPFDDRPRRFEYGRRTHS